MHTSHVVFDGTEDPTTFTIHKRATYHTRNIKQTIEHFDIWLKKKLTGAFKDWVEDIYLLDVRLQSAGAVDKTLQT